MAERKTKTAKEIDRASLSIQLPFSYFCLPNQLVMRILLYISFLLGALSSHSQFDFNSAYNNTQNVPEGLLEAVAWTNTHMVHRDGSLSSCSGIPQAVGVMGLHTDGAGYFNNTAIEVATLSNISVQQQIANANDQIMAYALAFEQVISGIGGNPDNPSDLREALHIMSEIPDTGFVNLLAKDMQVYSIFKFMMSND